MANLNKVFLIGRLTRDAEDRTFNSGGRMVKFGLAVNNRKKDQSGEWVDDPVFVDVAFFCKGDSKVGDIAAHLGKGEPLMVEGRLQLEKWQDKQSGQQRQKLSVVAENLQFMGSKKEDGQQSPYAGVFDPDKQRATSGPSQGSLPMGGEEDIPF